MKGPHSAVELENKWEIKAETVVTTIIKKEQGIRNLALLGVLLI